MQINLNTELQPLTRAAAPTAKPAAATVTGPEVSLDQSAALDSAFGRVPSVRTAEVERAQALAASNHYPPQEMVQRISRLLAMHIDVTSPE